MCYSGHTLRYLIGKAKVGTIHRCIAIHTVLMCYYGVMVSGRVGEGGGRGRVRGREGGREGGKEGRREGGEKFTSRVTDGVFVGSLTMSNPNS